ncbi:MAG: FKBP-type peptidyl-prolyl cis-trans isomerase [Clostridia bacterium]|nr:FKBP-type peptidyl-prolyl cis-trans isomerase [Clostridia bacterium]
MKKTIKISALLLVLLMVFALSSCGKKESGGKTLIFGDTDLSKYVKLGKYKSLSVDTASQEYKTTYEENIKSDVKSKDLYTKKYEGKVAEGDIANIDYVGKKDGVAFDGGTANGYDLTIGSHSFIDGFEDGLIGVDIGNTVDLDLTFPENYQSEELAGAAVVFTVKVNYVKSADSPDIESIYSELGFKSVKDYEADLKKRTVKDLLFDNVVKTSEVEDYPQKDINIYIDALYDYYDSYYKKNYGKNFKDVLKSNNMTVDDFKKQMSSEAETQMNDSFVAYAILQKENLKAEYDLDSDETTGQEVLDEVEKVEKAVKDFVYKNAKTK